MRILVVDDHHQFGANLAFALAGGGHEVRAVLSPRLLPEQLRERWDLALVDLEFSRDLGAPDSTGLAALDLLAATPVPSAIYAAETEENRALFLLAAFRFFEPLAVIDKHLPDRHIREFVDRFADGTLPRPDPSGDRYRTPPGAQPLLDLLIRSERDLHLWQAVATHDRRPEAARAAYVGARTFDKFLSHADTVIQDVETVLFPSRIAPLGPARSPAESSREARQARLIRVHRFAALHRRFFYDPTLRDLVSRRGQTRRK